MDMSDFDILISLKWHICVCDFHIIHHLLCGLQEEEPQRAHLMSITWVFHIAASVLTGR